MSAEESARLVSLLRSHADLALDASSAPVSSVDPGDDYLLALAAQERAALVSGDRHVLELGAQLPIYTPRDFLGRLPS